MLKGTAMHRLPAIASVVAALALAACTGAVSEPLPISTPPPELPGVQPATPTANPTAPPAEDGTPFGGPAAPLLEGVTFAPNRDSVVVLLPAVANARDYRVFRLPAGAAVRTVEGGGEQVDGTTIFCAGYQQHNDGYTGTRELLRVVEVLDVTGPTALVVEALDTACPFPGPLATQHADIRVDTSELEPADHVTFSLYTEAEIRARFGSLVVNGHGGGQPYTSPGPTTAPKVLARTTVTVTPLGRATPLTRDVFDDFDGSSGPLEYVGEADDGDRAYKPGRHFRNTKWEFFTYNDHEDTAALLQVRGALHVTLPDWAQDVFASVVAVPRRPAKLAADSYLHLTFEVASNATARRYWWVGLCGAETAGQTFDAQGRFQGRLVQTPFFYQPDGLATSVEGWNCLQFFPRDGSPFELPPTDTRTESDVRVMVNVAGAPEREGVVNVSPAQYPLSAARPSWFRQQDANGTLGAGLLDDQLRVSPRTRFDAWVRRDRLVLYVNGEQRLCNDFPSHALTMAEAAVAFGQVLYHSSAERLEFGRDFNLRTGQRYYLENAAFVDERDWDNVGYEELVPAPTGFDASKCFVYRP